MRLVVFGATGRTGRPLVEQALRDGYEVTAFVRDSSKLDIQHERLRIIEGDVLDAAAVDESVDDQDVVLSALGHTKSSPKDVQTRGTENIVAAMKQHGVGRLISLTGAGVADSKDDPKFVDKAIVFLLKTFQGAVLEDAERHAEVLRKSDLEWVIVRGPRLTEGERKGEYRVGYVGKNSGTQISRADMADFMLKQLTSKEHLHTAPLVSY